MMTFQCDDIRGIIDAWERDGSVPDPDYRAVREHIEGCSACARRYGALLKLLQRDGTVRSLFEEPGDQRSDIFSERVLSKMTPLPSRVLYRTLAAAALLIVGILGFTLAVLPRMGGSSGDGAVVEVHFSLTAPDAERVTLVGDFTDWEASKCELTDQDGDGIWEAWVPLRRDRMYEYNFIIDGEMWISDPGAIMQVDDGFGGESSLLSL